jgi:type III secretory pathway lipoprotein EscJ/flagellar biogenesis protein FliO
MDAQHPSPSSRDRLALAITPAQVIALGLVAVSIGWAVWLLRDRPTSEEVELLAGMALPSSEMAIMEAAFDRAQLTDHRTDGGRVWVPRSRQSAYMRALVDAEALPREFGGSLRRALEKNSPWQSRAVQDELLRVATQEELSLVICSMPGIERAAVLYDTESHHNLEGGGPAKTASVNVRTQPDMELDPARVQAIRVLVSASIAGLTPERVAVTDLRSGRVYVGPIETDADRETAAIAGADPALARKIAHEHHLATKVRQALAFLKGATVDVSVEFDVAEIDTLPLPPGPESVQGTRPADVEASQPGPMQKLADANAPAEIRPRSAIIVASPPPPPPPQTPARATTADMPGAILVSIAVPDSYFQAAGRAAVERAGQPVLQPIAIEAQESERIRRHVLSLLPATRDPSQRRVIITSFPVAATSLARREPAGRSTTGPQATATPAAPQSAEHGTPQAHELDAVISAMIAGRFTEVPRQAWLAATSICVGLLAGFLWWAGGRRQSSSLGLPPRHGMQQPRIDWSGVGDRDADGISAGGGSGYQAGGSGNQTGGGFGIGRAAALLLGLCACAGPAQAAGPESSAAVAPLPETILNETQFSGDQSQPGSLQAVTATVGTPAATSTLGTQPRRVATGLGGGNVPQVLPALPLSSRSDGAAADLAAGSPGRSGQLTDWKLLAAIAAAFAVVAVATAFNRRRTTVLPPDVFEVLGEGSLGGQHAVRIVRFGPKTLLVGVSAAGCQTLAELSDPQATACIAAACRGVHPPIRPPASSRSTATQSQPSTTARTGGEAA